MAMKIVFYDGECGICDGFIHFLMDQDKQKILKYAPLQGETAKSFFSTPPELSTMIFSDGTKVYYRSEAALRAVISTGGKWKFLYLLLWIPKFLRDGVYRVVSKHRHQIIKNPTCRFLNVDEKRLFLP